MRLSSVAALVVLPCAALPAQATSFDLALQAGSARYTSEEFLPDGRLFNREQGRLGQSQLTGLLRLSAGWEAALQLRQASGTVDYQGQTQMGLPLFTQTRLVQEDGSLRLHRRGPAWGGAIEWALGGGVGALRVGRDIQPTPISSRLTETLRARHWLLGGELARTQSILGVPVRGALALEWRKPWRQTLSVDTHGVLDGVLVLEPARRSAWRGGLSLEAQLQPGWRLGLNLSADLYQPGASAGQVVYRNGIPVGQASYPGSRQHTLGGSLSSTWSF